MRNGTTTGGTRAFTITEILVVMGVIALLIAVLMPALTGALRTRDMAKSMNNLKQIALWMRNYSTENREYIVPSQFDYTNSVSAGYPVKVRSHSSLGTMRYMGTWTDILWTQNGLGQEQAGLSDQATPDLYLFDSPDKTVFEELADYDEYPFRSAAPNSRHFKVGGIAKPFGQGAEEAGLPGYFAANNFFKQRDFNGVDPEQWWTNGQIRAPERSMYLIDSLAGETIDPEDEPYDNVEPPGGGDKTIEVDFRYSGSCLLLFLDGHVDSQTVWTNLADLESRRVRVRNLQQ